MGVKFQDYYQILGVNRDASAEQIRRAFRKLARQYHPDVNKDPGAAEKFKQINEANEVLSDAEKRKRYDALGADWQGGQDFRPPPGWEQVFMGGGGRGQRGFSFKSSGDFSDFFEALFGQMGGAGSRRARGRGGPEMDDLFSAMGGGSRAAAATPMPPVEAQFQITLEEAHRGGTRQIQLQSPDGQTRRIDVKVPAGVTDGAKIRLKGQGGDGRDLMLKVRIAPDSRYEITGHDLTMELKLSPWEAALGAKLAVQTLDGEVELTVPPGASGGQKLRLKDKGLSKGKDGRGDLLVRLKIVLPKKLTKAEQELFEQLAKESKFDPRGT